MQMEIHSKNIIESLEAKIANHADPKEEDLLISNFGIMETCAPYIGRMCAEYLNGEWLWQPYSRDSQYCDDMTEAEYLLSKLETNWTMEEGLC